jgi:hypothetical protein
MLTRPYAPRSLRQTHKLREAITWALIAMVTFVMIQFVLIDVVLKTV